MSTNNSHIALTFSGGGYRAATFHLGVLSYLHAVKVDQDATLLKQVVALSTISGGTITGLRYMLGLSRGESTEKVIKDLYVFLTEVDLATTAMNHLSSYKEGMSASLIRTMADIYDKQLFGGARFGKLMDEVKQNHITQFSANATDFTNGLSFRYQATTGKQEKETGYGVIGNNQIRIPRTIARHIRLAEILACSSCFPSGFEPVMFPQDFDLGESQEVKEYIKRITPFGIMDGGIVDNQGIEPILLAEQRMKSDFPGRKDKCLDLIVISDVSSPYMDAYAPTDIQLPNWISRLNLHRISSFLWIVAAIFSVLLILSLIYMPNSFISGVLAVLWAIAAGGCLAYNGIKKKIVTLASGTVVGNSISSILNLKFGDMTTLVANRVSSVLLLVTSVFMKHLRRMNYRSAYTDEAWMNRCITNGIYELRAGESWESNIKSGYIPAYLKPSERIQENSRIAASMGTTLWFTEEEKTSGMPDAIVAAGQYTMCFNLLKYIECIKKDSRNTTQRHEKILACEKQLRADWERFQESPLWMVEAFRAKI